MRCAAITSGGDRCKLQATHGSYCWSHAPETAEERRRRARRGGKSGGNGRGGLSEIADVKRHVRGVISGTLSGRIDKGVAAVAFQGFNTLLKAVEQERRTRELEELEARLVELERAQDERGGARWRA